MISCISTQATCPYAPWFHTCHDTPMHVACLGYDFMSFSSLILTSFQRNVSPHNCSTHCSLSVETQLPLIVSPSATQEDFHRGTHCSLSDYDSATTVSAVFLRALCRTKEKNDSKGRMVCKLVHNDYNMCGVDIYHLPPSLRSLSALFFFQSPSFLSTFLTAISLLPRPFHIHKRV